MTAHFKSIVADYDALVIYLTASNQGFNRQKIEALLSIAIGSRLIFKDKQNRFWASRLLMRARQTAVLCLSGDHGPIPGLT